jgi:WD40 repeat protein
VPASDGRSLRVLSLEGAELAANLAPHQHKIRALAFSSDGSRFATQDGRGVLRLWSSDGTQIKEQRTLRGLEHGGLVFAPGAGIVAVRGGSKIMLWHTDGPGRIEQRPGQFVRFLPDGALVRVEGDMLVIDGLDGAERYAKSFREPIVYAVSDDARWAIVSERGITRYVVLD